MNSTEVYLKKFEGVLLGKQVEKLKIIDFKDIIKYQLQNILISYEDLNSQRSSRKNSESRPEENA